MSDPRFTAAIAWTPELALELARAHGIPPENAVSNPGELVGRNFDAYVAEFILSDEWHGALAPCFATWITFPPDDAPGLRHG